MTLPNVVLSQFESVLPRFRGAQAELVTWTAACHEQAQLCLSMEPEAAAFAAKCVLRYSVRPDKIAFRSFDCPDFLTTTDWATKSIYRVTPEKPEGADIFERTQFFAEKALKVFRQLYPLEVARPDHLVHVTCTGYISPSAPQRLIAEDTWNERTGVTHAYHMGCYAALPAVRIAAALAMSSTEKDYQVDVVHTEMCGLHMNPVSHTPEQIVVQSLFADGHIKYSLGTGNQSGLKILGLQEWLIPNSEKDMSWVPSSWGMQMTLSREVPDKIAAVILPFLESLCQAAHQDLSKILTDAIFAIHPGGPKIIEGIETLLKLSRAQVVFSHEVFRERGNMSSATLPHIWKEILDSKPAVGSHVVSFAFGPGLTLFGAVFEVV